MKQKILAFAAVLLVMLSGAALSEDCTNECLSGMTQCSDSRLRSCGNYDSDSCLEWSTYIGCGIKDCDTLDHACRDYDDIERGCYDSTRCRIDSEVECSSWRNTLTPQCTATFPANPGVCPNKCAGDVWHYDGRNVSGACIYTILDCTNLSREAGTRFCSGNEVRVRFEDFYCSDGCRASVIEKTVASCETYCTDGVWRRISGSEEERRVRCDEFACLLGDCRKTKENFVISRRDAALKAFTVESAKTVEFPVNVSSYPGDASYARAKISSGLFFGSSELSLPARAKWLSIRFTIASANLIAPLRIEAGNRILYENISAPGNYTVFTNETFDGTLKISAASSGWAFWMPNEYELANVSISGLQAARENDFDFVVQKNEYENFRSASVENWPANAGINLNGRWLSSTNVTKDYLATGANKIKFFPAENTNTAAKVALKIVYSSEVTAG